MKALNIIFLSFALSGCIVSNTASVKTISANNLIIDVEFKRGNIVVADINRALTIYRDILGFSVDRISDSSPDSYSCPVFDIPKEAKLRFASLSSPTQTRTFTLTEVTDIELPKLSTPHMSTNVIRVVNMNDVINKIEAVGLKTVREQRATTPEGISFIERAFVDFDGHLVVLYELLTSP